jgi:hypothetical protein
MRIRSDNITMTNKGNRKGGASRIPQPVNSRANYSKRTYNPPKVRQQQQLPLLPSGVNNKATMPKMSQDYMVRGEEVIQVINVGTGSTAGQIIYNELITPLSALRLGILSGAWQRIDWKQASLHLVALNGSVVQSGYTMGWLEDPEIVVPTAPSAVIPFLTALRSTTVRQAWVESESGVQVAAPDKPEMYTQPGSDIRRYSPGRLVIAVAGDVAQQATFQLMLKYAVRLYVPLAVSASAPPPPATTVIDGAYPGLNNCLVAPTSISCPAWAGSQVAGTLVTLINRLPVITAGTTAPTSDFRLIPAGATVTINPLTTGSPASVTYAGISYNLAFTDTTTGQFRAFNAVNVTAASVGLRMFEIA